MRCSRGSLVYFQCDICYYSNNQEGEHPLEKNSVAARTGAEGEEQFALGQLLVAEEPYDALHDPVAADKSIRQRPIGEL